MILQTKIEKMNAQRYTARGPNLSIFLKSMHLNWFIFCTLKMMIFFLSPLSFFLWTFSELLPYIVCI